MTQRKLDKTEIQGLQDAVSAISGTFDWDADPLGVEAWRKATERLKAMERHGTSDGKTWVEPAPPIGEGWRLLGKDESVEKGDEFFSPGISKWDLTSHSAGRKQSTQLTYRRRIEAKPAWRPFANMEEFRQHRLGWICAKGSQAPMRLLAVSNLGIRLYIPSWVSWESLLEFYVFEDGGPCGVLEVTKNDPTS